MLSGNRRQRNKRTAIHMIKKHKIRFVILAILLCLFCFMWLNNTNLFMSKSTTYQYMAHRGVSQTFDESQTDNDSNTAMMIDPPHHEYLENTIASMQAAFDYGAEIVELDIKLTKDEQLAVFHDSTLEFRTNATGEIQDYTMEELKKLDIGYGYSSDNGVTFPFRGKGVGLMPELNEVLTSFPDKKFLIHIKDGNLRTAEVLSERLKDVDTKERENLLFYGSDNLMEYLNKHNPEYKTFAKKDMMKALIQYELIGWTGIVPNGLRDKVLLLPSDYAPFIWGFPQRFLRRMESVDTIVILAKGDGSPAEGFDTQEELQEIPSGFDGYVWTNGIDILAK